MSEVKTFGFRCKALSCYSISDVMRILQRRDECMDELLSSHSKERRREAYDIAIHLMILEDVQ